MDDEDITENIDDEYNINYNLSKNKINNIGSDYVFVNKPVNKNVLDTLLDNSNEIINKIKKFI